MPGPTFNFEGKTIQARPGDSIAASLQSAEIFNLGTTRTGRERGVFCGMGVCQDCLVMVDGKRSVRACMTEVTDGMQVRRQSDLDSEVPVQTYASAAPRHHEVDLLIIGAGPAGMNAAIAAAKSGINILVLDERSAAGGQYFKPQTEGYRGDSKDSQHLSGDALRKQFHESGATLRQGVSVWFARAHGAEFEIRFLDGSQQEIVTARAVIVATGAYEKPAVFPGWTLPNVMTIGAAQTYARRYGVVPPGRVLVAGQGPLALQLANELLELGADVVGVAERSAMKRASLLKAALISPRLGLTGAGYLWRLKRRGVPLWTQTEIAAVEPSGRVTLKSVSGNAQRHIEVDAVCTGEGFLPQMELARLFGCPVEVAPNGAAGPMRQPSGETPVAGLWVAGDAGGLGGAQVAASQGALSGAAAARFLCGKSNEINTAPNSLTKALKFQRLLWQAYDVPLRDLPEGDTIVCRCESVTAGQIRSALDESCSDEGAVKRSTRCGMGRCQGRFCLPTLTRMLGTQTGFAPQIPSQPIPAIALQIEKPEWGGHEEARPSARPDQIQNVPLSSSTADLVVIGAGVTGISAARQAAKRGAKCVVLDRGRIAAEASGGNAGSLHLQLLSWDFGEKAIAGGSPQLMTLPLQQQSIARWGEIERDLGSDFEMRVTGGLMLAEDAAQIAFLEAKAKAERGVGIETDVIGPAEIHKIAPHLSDHFAAAAWCAGEGKINPLLANRALAKAARSEGVEIAEMAGVIDVEQDGSSYIVKSARGDIRTSKVVIAAGGWSAQIGRMFGVELPIRGAPLQMIVTEPAPQLVPCLVAHADRHLTLKQTDVGTLLIGGAWPSRVGPEGQTQVLPDSLEGNLWVAARTVPAVSGLSILRSWAAMNIDIDGAPLLSTLPGHQNVVIAATANGYTLGPVIGEAAADAALNGAIAKELSPFTLTRFQNSKKDR